MSFERMSRDELLALLQQLLDRSERVRSEQHADAHQWAPLLRELVGAGERAPCQQQAAYEEQARRLDPLQAGREQQAEPLAAQLRSELRAQQLELQNRQLRAAQHELERARERYADLYEFAPLPYLAVDEDYVIRALNLNAAALLKRPREALLGQSFARLACADNPAPLHELVQSARATPLGAGAELALTVGGESLRMQLFVSERLDPSTRRSEFRCVLVDVTARARAEAERAFAHAAERALHRRFELLDGINVSLSTVLATRERTSTETVLVTALEHALGLLAAERVSITLAGDRPLTVRRCTGLPSECPARLELRVPVRLGARELGQLAVAYDRELDGTIAEAQCTLELLAERVALALEIARLNRAEQEERERLALLEYASREFSVCNDLQATEAALAGILRATVPGFADAALLFVRDGDGYRALEPVHLDAASRRLLRRMTRRIAERLDDWAELSRGGATRPAEELVSARFAARLGVDSVALFPLRARRLSLGYALFGCRAGRRDAAALREALEQLAERCASALDIARLLDQLRLAVESRDTLLAIVSHDLRSPLNAISITARTLAPLPPEHDRRRSVAQVQLIQRSAAHMDTLIEDLLTAANMDTGQFAVEPDVQHPGELVREAHMLNEPLAIAKELRFVPSCAPDLPAVVADRARVLQVLTNLLGNAIKFTPRGGALEVSAERVRDEVRFAVLDTGPGIPPHQLRQVFERYWTGDSRRKGLGLGLFIAERIVSAHRGRIWVESAPGKGACFCFTLPLATADEPCASVRLHNVSTKVRGADASGRSR